jgi:hypothetical protein
VLAGPLVTMVKCICDHVESLQPVSEFLSGHDSRTPAASTRESASA